MDIIAEDPGAIEAEFGLRLVAYFEAGGEEGVMADVLENRELSAGNVSGEKAGAGREGNDVVGSAGDNLNRDGDFGQGARIECGT